MPRKKKDEEGGGVPGWMVTYGDLMTLLLTFFVLLLSFSTISEEKLNQAMNSVLQSLGVLPKNSAVVQIMKTNPPAVSQRMPRRAERIAREIMRMMQVVGESDNVQIEYDKEGGLTIELPDRVLFDTARAELKPDAYPIMTRVGELLADIPDKSVEIRGHTDNRPLRTASPGIKDNQDLSYHRAKNVMVFLHERGRIPQNEFEVVACGEWQPVATNDTEEGMRANRRVSLQIQGDFGEEAVREMRRAVGEALAPESTVDVLPAPAR